MSRSWIALILAMLATPALAQQGDATSGRLLAEANCVDCHDIEPDGAAKQYPPSFASIAGFRSDEQILSRIFYPPYHAGMPQFGGAMLPQEVHDLAAYIRSLDTER